MQILMNDHYSISRVDVPYNVMEALVFPFSTHRYQTLAVATDANTKEDIGNKKISGKKLTVITSG